MIVDKPRLLSVLTMSVAALGSISLLLVGGVGILTSILTIMTTTVRKRTSEVGLLRALGST